MGLPFRAQLRLGSPLDDRVWTDPIECSIDWEMSVALHRLTTIFRSSFNLEGYQS